MKKAMLLAAGRGERLRPLTDTIPKPLIAVRQTTLIENNLRQLKAAGIEEVVINVCYRAQQIIEHVGNGHTYGLKITFSYEPDTPLGTGGGILHALPLLGEAPFVLLSSDIWTDYPFETLYLPANKSAHLIMVDNPYFHLRGDYSLLPTGILNLHAQPKYTYSSIAVIHPKLFTNNAKDSFSLAELFNAHIEKNRISGELYHGQWFNVGTEEELQRLKQSLD